MCSCYECRVHGRSSAEWYTIGRMDRPGDILETVRVQAESADDAFAQVRRVLWIASTLVVLRTGA